LLSPQFKVTRLHIHVLSSNYVRDVIHILREMCVCVYVLVMVQLPYHEVNSAMSHDPVAASREPIVAQHYMAPNTGLQATSQEFSELVYATNLKRTL